MRQLVAVLRSSVYLLLQAIITPPYALVVLATFPLSPLARYRVYRVAISARHDGWTVTEWAPQP